MRIYFQLTPNTQPVPFNYQHKLVSLFHRWLGHNELHDDISLYSLSWLQNGRARKGSLDFPHGAQFHISAPDQNLLAELISGIHAGWKVGWGMEIHSVTLQRTPDFGPQRRFIARSPILVQRRNEDGQQKYYFPKDENVDEYLTETLRHKLNRAQLTADVQVAFDHDFPNPKIKGIQYKGLHIKACACPVIVKGDPRAVAFAWEVGIGNSTGIGFVAVA